MNPEAAAAALARFTRAGAAGMPGMSMDSVALA